MTIQDGDIVRITAVMDHSLEGDVQNVFHFLQLGGSSTDLQCMQNAAYELEDCYDWLVPYMPDTLTFVEVRGFNVTQNKPLVTLGWPTLTDGEVDVAHPLPSVMSCLCFQRTGMNRVVGKKYFGPFTEDNQTDAEWTSAIPSACLLGMNTLTAGRANGNGMLTCGVYSPTLQLFQYFAEIVARSVPAYQRRRKRGVGS